MCEKAYTAQQVLNRHLKRFHGVEPSFECEKCGAKLSSQKGLNMHEARFCVANAIDSRTIARDPTGRFRPSDIAEDEDNGTMTIKIENEEIWKIA